MIHDTHILLHVGKTGLICVSKISSDCGCRCEILLIEAKKVLLNAILTKEMKNSNLFLLSTLYCKNFKTSFVYDLVS